MTTTPTPAFNWSLIRTSPLKGIGIGFVLFLRFLYGVFYAGAAYNKFQQDYLFSDYPLKVFQEQLVVIDPDGIMALYLREFLIPNYQFVGWVVAWGELAVAISLLFGLGTRWGGALALFITINIGLGGFYDASLIPLGIIAVLFIIFPTGHWLGLDRRFNLKYPGSIWFR